MAFKTYIINDNDIETSNENKLAYASEDGEPVLVSLNDEQLYPGGGGGGENPNTQETVTGTLANPFSTIDTTELRTALLSKQATGYLEINASALGAGTIRAFLTTNANHETIYVSGANFGPDLASTSAFYVSWDLDPELQAANMLSSGNIVDISSYKNNITTSLTVVWTPLDI